MSEQFAAMENSYHDVDSNRAWDKIRENINISAKESLDYYQLKQHKPQFNEERSKKPNCNGNT
jgi:hypothetical protein